jgi:S1-C subfamily serine protease
VLEQLIQKGTVQRGSLGVTIQNMTSALAESFGLKEVRGIVVSSVTPGSAAEKAGLRQGDIILRLDGREVNDTNEFRNLVAGTAPGADVTLTVWRDGSERQIRARLGELSPENARAQQQQPEGNGGAGGRLGITVEPLTPELAAQLRLRRGTQGMVVTRVDPAGPAAQAGIQPGDVIQEVNRQPVRSPEDVRKALQRSGDRPPLLLVNRGGQTLYLSVPTR